MFIIVSFVPNAAAARFYLESVTDMVQGCPATVAVMIDTENSDVLAADMAITYDADELMPSEIRVGDALPMQVFNQITGDQIQFSASREPVTGSFNGVGIFGYIDFVAGYADGGNFLFSSDLEFDNVIASSNIVNVITGIESMLFQFRDRYNVDVDGVGFCTVDAIPPTVSPISPADLSVGNALDTDVVFSLEDDRVGVDMDTLNFTIDGISYDRLSDQVNITEDDGVFLVEANPDANFDLGKDIVVSVYVCDNNDEPDPNCVTDSYSFIADKDLLSEPVAKIVEFEKLHGSSNDCCDTCAQILFPWWILLILLVLLISSWLYILKLKSK